MKTFKDLVNEVAQPLSQGEKNFKALHGSVEAVNRDMVPGVTDQDHIFKGNPRREDPRTASYEDLSDSEAQYDKTLKRTSSEVEENYKPPGKDIDAHFKKQSQKMQDAINLHLRKGNSYWDSYRKAKVHVKEGWVALGPATKPGEKPKSPFNNLGNPNPGTKIYGDRPELKPAGRGNRSATDIKGMREETINEKTLTPAEMKKREEIVKAIKRGNKGMDKSMAYAIATKTAKRVAEDYDMDYEGEMAKAELNAICDKAGVLAEMLENDTQLEAWLQSKITKAKYMIDSVYDYMMYSQPNVSPEPENQSSAMASNYGSFLNRMGESLEEGVVDVFAHERNDKSAKIQDWSRSKLDKHRKIPHGSYSRKDIEDEHKRRIRTSEYEMRSKEPVKEEIEQLDELSKKTMANYVGKAVKDKGMADRALGREDSIGRSISPILNKMNAKREAGLKHDSAKRQKGINMAVSKLAKEETEQLDELSKKTLGSYIKKAADDIGWQAADAGKQLGAGGYKSNGWTKHLDKAKQRIKGVAKATDRLTKEELELDEARRGRPRKDGSKPEGEDDGGREHIVMQLRKVVNLRGQKPVEFNDNSKHDISVEHAKKALAKHDSMHKAADKQAYAERLAKSHGSFKSAVSEAVDPTTMKSDRGDVKPFVRQDATGKFVVGKRREGRKELSVDAKMNEELKGNQHKIDANKNGKVDAHDFKLLKHKKKMLESVKANMAQDSVDKIKKDPLASKEKIVLPPTQGNKPVGGEDQVHTGKFSVAEETALNNLYESLSDKNKARFEEKMQTEEGIEELLAFALEQGF